MSGNVERLLAEYSYLLQKTGDEQNQWKDCRLNRSFPASVVHPILKTGILRLFIPHRYGGLNATVHDCLKMLDISAYHALPMSLLMGINGALFIQPVAKYAEPNVAEEIFKRYRNEPVMGGLMITEPEYGSDALHMETFYQTHKDGFDVKGKKHWAGLTGVADYWLITAREKHDTGRLGRDVSFFIHDNSKPGITVEELYNNAGLYMLPYGRNRVDIRVPGTYKLVPETTGISIMLDTLHRSRLQFPGMAIGFLRRLLDEALVHVNQRVVGKKKLLEYEQVQYRISGLQTNFMVSSAMCIYSGSFADISNNTVPMDLQANIIKAVVTDMMQESAQSYQQLCGAMGYQTDHLAFSGIADSRPFQIFEGSNDILYQQIYESAIKYVKQKKLTSLNSLIRSHPFLKDSTWLLNEDIGLEQNAINQSRQVQLGKAIGRVACMSLLQRYTADLFPERMLSSAMDDLKEDIAAMISAFKKNSPKKIDSYFNSSETDWFTITRSM
ncbi:acyl-CoA dehydrogenase [Balneolaceae bacterium ANBcel3]|nr:acyl-CoA dehydrogenase [Balneolaceae bacterium ANBcel3]